MDGVPYKTTQEGGVGALLSVSAFNHKRAPMHACMYAYNKHLIV